MKRVLIIEDNCDNLRLLTYILHRSGYEVLAAETGEEGVELALRENPAFVLVDINLPDIDGFEVTKRIRNSGVAVSLPVIAITSHAMMGDRDRILAAGCSGYFEKPIDPMTIMDQIHEVVRGKGKP